jgi:hypothetical protein
MNAETGATAAKGVTILDKDGDGLCVEASDGLLVLSMEGRQKARALTAAGVARLMRQCELFLGVKDKPGMEVPVSITADTSQAKAAVDELCASVEALTVQAERLAAVTPLRVGGTTTVTNVASQDPEACWRTIQAVLQDVKSRRLTVAQGAVILRTAVTLIGHEEAQHLLAPYAQQESPKPTAVPDAQAAVASTLQGIGSILAQSPDDIGTPERAGPKLGGAPTGTEKPSPVGLKVSVAVNVRGEDVLVIVDSSWTIGYLKRAALDASKHRTEYGMDWLVFDAAGLVRRDHEIIQDVLSNLISGEWCLSIRSPSDISY